MELIDNISKTLKYDMTVEIKDGSKMSIAAACFSIYAFQELKRELKGIDELRFIFTSPTFISEKTKKEKRELFHALVVNAVSMVRNLRLNSVMS